MKELKEKTTKNHNRFRYSWAHTINAAFEGRIAIYVSLLREHAKSSNTDDVFDYEPLAWNWPRTIWMRNLHDIYQIRGDHHTQGRHQEYAKLIEALPASTFEYYSMCDQSVTWNRVWFLMKLCEHHKGEVVQITLPHQVFIKVSSRLLL